MGVGWHFCLQYHLGLYIMQEPSYLEKIALVSMWLRMGIDPNNNLGMQDSLTLTYTPNINI